MRPPPDGGSVAGTGTAAGEGGGGGESGGGTNGAGRERDSCNSGGVSDTADEPLLSEPLSMASVQRAAAKRRGTAALGKSSVMTGAFGTSGTPSERLTSIGGGRRRRLLLYTSAFLVMLVLSSVLDVRRATLRSRRRSRVQLALPSGPSLGSTQTTTATSSTKDLPGTASGNGSSANTKDGGHGGRVVLGAVNSSNPQRVNIPPRMQQQQQQQQKQQQALQPPASGTRRGQQKLSEQELKDDVDQLIAHVEQESSSASNNGTSSSTRVGGSSNSSSSVSSVVKSGNGGSSARATPSPGASAAQHIPVNGTATAEEVSSRLTAEEAFAAAQRKIEGFAKNESVKPFLDTNEMRTLQALGLQATRGDCESSASSPGSTGGSLFKTDAEAASNVDIEKSDALWGAWCLFVGSYRSDAMRDYVSKASALEARIERSLQSPGVGGNAGTSPGNAGPPFDERSASLRDVLSPEEEAALVSKAAMVAPHLHENELRYLAALSLQATFGDCGPYASVHEKSSGSAASANGSEAPLPRPLTEPVFRKTANRGEGALWGAWCVFQGRKRAFAATQLAERLGLLLSQLAQKLRIGGDQAQSQTRSERDSVLTQSGRLSTQNVVSEAE